MEGADRFEHMREAMVSQQIESRGVQDGRVLEAMRDIPRHEFVPPEFAAQAYEDGPLPIGHEQTISQPYVAAFMTEVLEIQPGDRVLEIGTGSGYQAALLAKLAKEVFTIEILEPLYREARARLEAMGYGNIRFRLGDGWQGWPDEAPFDKIMVTAAPDHIPEALVGQLREGGLIIAPVGGSFGQNLVLGRKERGRLYTQKVMPVRFVPLVRDAGAKDTRLHEKKP